MYIDTHCHAGLNWFEPIENLIFQMDKNLIERSVLVQHKGSTNDYLYECLENYPDKFSVIAAINWHASFENQLNEFNLKGVSGVRIYLDYDEVFGNKGNEFFENCSNNNLVVSLASDLKTFSSKEFKNLIEKNNKTNFVIEHLAGVGNFKIEDILNIKYLFNQVLNLAENKNLFMKIPGLGEINSRPELLNNNSPFKDDESGFIKQAVDAFSSENLMWGSDYPPVSNREGYRNSFEGIFNLNFLSEKDKSNIFINIPKKLFF
jgi:L-fuconolactonase